MKFRKTSTLVACFAIAACTGSVSERTATDGQGGDAAGGEGGNSFAGMAGQGRGDGGKAGTDVDPELGTLPLRRLTRWEYENTIKDLLGAPASYAATYPADDVSKHGFATATNTSELMVTAVGEASDALSRFATDKLETLAPCAASANDACAKDFIEKFGQRAFRRPLSTGEKQDLFAIYDLARKDPTLDFKNGMRVLLSAMLQSPQFLYHWEQGDERITSSAPGTARLGEYHLASRLSYFLWGTMPDAALFASAEAKKLGDGTELEKQARRMLSDSRSRGMVGDYFTQLLYLNAAVRNEKDSKTHPGWTLAVRSAALAESKAFAQDVVLDGDGLWRSVMTAGHSFVDENLAKLYGVTASKGAMLVKTDLPRDQRSGLLTQAAFLSATSGATDGALVTPIHRGETIRKRLLCQTIPPPLANIQSKVSSGVTTRERLSSHVSDPQCATCHSLMDDLGFAFENYDVTGKWRTTDNGKNVDSSGEIAGLDSGTPKFQNARELAALLTTTPEASECVVSNFLRYGLGRLETEGESKWVLKGLNSKELNVRDVLVKVVTSRGFSSRLLSQGEVLP